MELTTCIKVSEIFKYDIKNHIVLTVYMSIAPNLNYKMGAYQSNFIFKKYFKNSKNETPHWRAATDVIENRVALMTDNPRNTRIRSAFSAPKRAITYE